MRSKTLRTLYLSWTWNLDQESFVIKVNYTLMQFAHIDLYNHICTFDVCATQKMSVNVIYLSYILSERLDTLDVGEEYIPYSVLNVNLIKVKGFCGVWP